MQFWEYYEETRDWVFSAWKSEMLRLINKNEELAKQICSEAEKYYGVLQGVQEYYEQGEIAKKTEKKIVSFTAEQIVIKDDRLYGFIRESVHGETIDCWNDRLYVIPVSKLGEPVSTGKYYNEDGEYIGGLFYKYALIEYCTLMLAPDF